VAIEIERKFLVKNDNWREGAVGQKYMQGYLNREAGRTVRVRITEEAAYLTIKGRPEQKDGELSPTKLEFEYRIPEADAKEMLEKLSVSSVIRKTRYRIEHEGFIWEVDEFEGENCGLILAEIEIESEDQQFVLPDWIAQEVTSDKRYYNAYLAEHPYKSWVAVK